MASVKLRCGVYGEGSVLSVEIEDSAEVEALQEAIYYKKQYNHQYKLDSSAFTLYLARKKEGEDDTWLENNDTVKSFLRGEGYKEIRPSWKLNKKELFGPDFKPGEEEIQVLVELPKESAGGVARKQGEWSAKNLSAVDPEVQSNVWKSVVRISSEDVFSGTALVVDRTATHLYLLTNLHLWIEKDEKGKANKDKIFLRHLSADFKKEIKRYVRLGRMKNTKPNGQKRKPTDELKEPLRKCLRTLRKKSPIVSDKP